MTLVCRWHFTNSNFLLSFQFDGENMYMGMNDNAQEFLSANQVSVSLLGWAVW